MSETIRTEEGGFVRDGDEVRGVAVFAESAEARPAVIVVPDVHGIADLYLRIAERFARAGFVAFVIDLYSREGRPTLADMDAVFAWIDGLDDRRVLADISAAVPYVERLPAVDGKPVGIVGFCLGGQYAIQAACSEVPVAAAVSFYGMLRYAQRKPHKPASPLDLAPRLGCPYLGLFGAQDALIPEADVNEFAAILEREGKRFEIHSYPEAGHAFCNDTRAEAYRPAAAEDALGRAEAFFRAHLGGAR